MAFDVLKSGWQVFQRGKAVANPAAWRVYATSVQMVLALLTAIVALLRANGYELPVTDETLTQLATGVVGLVFGVRGVLGVITSEDRGLPSRRPTHDCGNDDGER